MLIWHPEALPSLLGERLMEEFVLHSSGSDFLYKGPSLHRQRPATTPSVIRHLFFTGYFGRRKND